MASGFEGLAPCVHCGFCLPACPTYAVTNDEADGPRGRIVLMQGLASGSLSAADDAVAIHLDRCLGCRACEPVCPSGVRYGAGLEKARAQITTARGVSLVARVVLATMAIAPLRRIVFGLARLARPLATWIAGSSRPGFVAGMLAGTRGLPQSASAQSAESTQSTQSALFLGCIQRELFDHVHIATRMALAANGVACDPPPAQGCCGALHAHAGCHDEAAQLARANVLAFRDTTGPIVVNSAGCGAMLKDYGALLAGDPLAEHAAAVAARVRDVAEVLAAAGPRPGAPLPWRVAYDAPCHLQHAQGIDDAPRTMLAAIPGLRLVPHAGADRCCGSAGLYSLLEPTMSREVLDTKLDALEAADVDVVLTGNPGCQMQIAAGLLARGRAIIVCHPVELLAASYGTGGLSS